MDSAHLGNALLRKVVLFFLFCGGGNQGVEMLSPFPIVHTGFQEAEPGTYPKHSAKYLLPTLSLIHLGSLDAHSMFIGHLEAH